MPRTITDVTNKLIEVLEKYSQSLADAHRHDLQEIGDILYDSPERATNKWIVLQNYLGRHFPYIEPATPLCKELMEVVSKWNV